jgi:polygalacturonase
MSIENRASSIQYPVSSIETSAPFQMQQWQPPSFPNRTFDIRDYGAVGDGKTKNTDAFARAIAEAARAGGGLVLVPKGIWLTGPIHLKSNINLHLAEEAELRFSTDFDDYLPRVFTRWEGTEMKTHSPLIYANGCTNIAITGPGLLNGQGKPWWDKKVRGEIHRPSFIQPINCRNILLEGFSIGSGPMWTIHPVYCENVIIRNVRVQTEGPNNDGINPDSCRNVLIEHCYISTGDDCIAIKSGRDEDGWRVGKPCQNIVVRNCRMKNGHGGVVIGSEMSGDVRNVFVRNCIFDGTDRGIRMKSRRGRGGVVENIWFQDIKMGRIRDEAIRMNLLYGSGKTPASKKPPTFRNIHIQNVTCQQAEHAIEIIGLPERPIENITLENVSISAEKGLSCTNAKDIKLNNVNIRAKEGPIIQLEDTEDMTIF